MNAEELAQKVADKFCPPYNMIQRKQPQRNYKHLPLEDQYETVYMRRTPEGAAFITFRAEDGMMATRPLSFLEIAEATLEILREEEE